jgi:hypothetical protein
MDEPIKVLVTERAAAPDDKTVLATPKIDQSNVEVVTMSWWQQVAIRGARTYIQSLVGFILAGQTGALNLPAKDFASLLWTAAGLALAPTVVSLLQNATEILARLDVNKPQVRA